MVWQVDAVVAGAGVVGLAAARALAAAGHEVLVLEAADCIGSGTSSRNSEVIHAGIYYPAGSLKAKLCVEGRRALYEFCAERQVAHRQCGKLIVATEAAQLGQLDAIRARAHANGATEVTAVSAAEVAEREPEVSCVGALWSPMTGIIDSHGLMLALRGEVEARGGALALKSPIVGGAIGEDGIRLEVGGDEPCTLLARRFVNAAGLDAQRVAGLLAGFPAARVPRQYLARGCYFTLAGRQPFRHLVYPVPEPGGLGVHVTLDLAGQARFGPDVEWIERPGYQVDPARAEKFYGAVRRYWPGLADGAIQPGYAGIRPKLSGPGEPDADFLVHGPAEHGVPGMVNFFGIESPGLTASLALARLALQLLENRPIPALA